MKEYKDGESACKSQLIYYICPKDSSGLCFNWLKLKCIQAYKDGCGQ